MTLLVRPYPTTWLPRARQALNAALDGELEPLYQVFLTARDALEDLDPDEVREPVLAHVDAATRDKAALAAALDEPEAWESVVSLAATFNPEPRLRGFLLTSAAARYFGRSPDLKAFKRYCRGEDLPGLSADDTLLYAMMPALIGLGPDHPEELTGPSPVVGEPVWKLLGLPEGDWEGIDPLDGWAIHPETCAAARGSADWADLLRRGAAEGGLLIRKG
ncbi:MAG: hypothetical protein EA397_11375 [Deltaproteobacteria bacterium]|nr:MAG: hypothetical protein EA397_11375 [Deltaproteobacteria bacterium]